MAGQVEGKFIELICLFIIFNNNQFIFSKAKDKSRMCWNEESEAILMDMWPTILGALRVHRKNGQIYAEMAEELSL